MQWLATLSFKPMSDRTIAVLEHKGIMQRSNLVNMIPAGSESH